MFFRSRAPRAMAAAALSGALLCWLGVAEPASAFISNSDPTSQNSPTDSGVPVAPAAPTLVPGDARIDATWVAPAVGGEPLSAFLVEVSARADDGFVAPTEGSCADVLLATDTACSITGLVNGTPAFVRVIAVNGVGPSTPSPAAGPVTPRTIPGAPGRPRAVGDYGALVVNWPAPASDGGSPVTGYRVRVGTSPTGPFNLVSQGTCRGLLRARSCQVAGLRGGRAYFVIVRAANVAGSGPASAVSASATATPRPDIVLAFGGDVHFSGSAAAQAGPGGLRTLPAIFAGADLSMVNLETAITRRGTPVAKEFLFRADPGVLSTLAHAGVDVVTMANNHGVDFGSAGLETSLRARRTSPVPIVGIGANTEDAIRPWTATVKGTSIAFFGTVGLDLVYEENAAVARSWPATADGPGLAVWSNHSRQILAAVRDWSTRVDVVVVYAHWGYENATCPNAAQRAEALALEAAGADIIVGAHPHVLQGGGYLGRAVVAYSLGNFAWYAGAGKPSSALFVRVRHNRATGYSWRPTSYSARGLPYLVRGAEARATRALLVDRSAARCTGLSSRRGSMAPLQVLSDSDGRRDLPLTAAERRGHPGLE